MQKSIEIEESLKRQLESLLGTQQRMLKREGQLLKEPDPTAPSLPSFDEQQLAAFFNDLNLIPDFEFDISVSTPGN